MSMDVTVGLGGLLLGLICLVVVIGAIVGLVLMLIQPKK
jgi:hypothetical protein